MSTITTNRYQKLQCHSPVILPAAVGVLWTHSCLSWGEKEVLIAFERTVLGETFRN